MNSGISPLRVPFQSTLTLSRISDESSNLHVSTPPVTHPAHSFSSIIIIIIMAITMIGEL